jgi:hypothetical protein
MELLAFDMIGNPIFAGDKVLSVFLQDIVTVNSSWTDTDGDVYLTYAGGNILAKNCVK